MIVEIRPDRDRGHLLVISPRVNRVLYDLYISLHPRDDAVEKADIDWVAKRHQIPAWRLWRAVDEFTKGGGFAAVRLEGEEVKVL